MESQYIQKFTKNLRGCRSIFSQTVPPPVKTRMRRYVQVLTSVVTVCAILDLISNLCGCGYRCGLVYFSHLAITVFQCDNPNSLGATGKGKKHSIFIQA